MSGNRHDAVFIRKSGPRQDEEGQIGNVRTMLGTRKIVVPEEYWVVGTVQRRKVRSNAKFNKLLDEIQSNRIRTVYIETQDRWGTADRHELFSLLAMLREHDTQLFDLRAGKDIAEKDLASEMMAFINSIKSEKELQDLSYRSLRTRISNIKTRSTWPTGTQPFGYAKQCWSPDNKLLWEWHPTTRVLGQTFSPDKRGKLMPGPEGVKLPKKDKVDVTKLIPSRNKEHVATIKLIFDLFTRAGLSRRQISTRLNKEGRKFYEQDFTHALVGMVLANPAYVGDIHFGKTRTAAYNTFDADGGIVEVKKSGPTVTRPVEERIIVNDAHEGLVSRKVWKLAQDRMKREEVRTSYPARNPQYYLKPLLKCGHCGKNMTGRTEIHPTTKERIIVYFCASYLNGKQAGIVQKCGAHRITHADAERLIFDKIKEQDMTVDETASKLAREQLQRQLHATEVAEDDDQLMLWEWIEEGVKALANHFKTQFGFTAAQLESIKRHGRFFYRYGKPQPMGNKLPVEWKELKAAIHKAERQAVEKATAIVEAKQASLRNLTLSWAQASIEMQAVLRTEIDAIEEELRTWRPRTQTVSERIKKINDDQQSRRSERQQLVAQWPKLEYSERAEALRQLLDTVELFWDADFRPGEKRPGRPRKTDRPGRYKYTLDVDRIKWHINPDAVTSR